MVCGYAYNLNLKLSYSLVLQIGIFGSQKGFYVSMNYEIKAQAYCDMLSGLAHICPS